MFELNSLAPPASSAVIVLCRAWLANPAQIRHVSPDRKAIAMKSDLSPSLLLSFSPFYWIKTFVLAVTALAVIGFGAAEAHPNCSQANDAQCYDPNNTCGQGSIEMGACVGEIGTYRCVWPIETGCPPSAWQPCNCGSTSTPGCFLAGTLITLADGSQMPIEQIGGLESVLSLDNHKLGRKSSAIVSVHEPREVDHYFIINGHLKASSDQPVFSDGAWIQVQDLAIGMMLTDVAGADVPIESISRIDEVATVYNIAVATGLYIANGVVVHNKDEGPLPYQLQPCWDCPPGP